MEPPTLGPRDNNDEVARGYEVTPRRWQVGLRMVACALAIASIGISASLFHDRFWIVAGVVELLAAVWDIAFLLFRSFSKFSCLVELSVAFDSILSFGFLYVALEGAVWEYYWEREIINGVCLCALFITHVALFVWAYLSTNRQLIADLNHSVQHGSQPVSTPTIAHTYAPPSKELFPVSASQQPASNAGQPRLIESPHSTSFNSSTNLPPPPPGMVYLVPIQATQDQGKGQHNQPSSFSPLASGDRANLAPSNLPELSDRHKEVWELNGQRQASSNNV